VTRAALRVGRCVRQVVAGQPPIAVQIDSIPVTARLGVKTQKIRHQLFLTKELSARLDRIALGTGRARSELLVEALEAWLSRRNSAAAEEALGARLTRFERHFEAVRRQQGLQWEVLARMLRQQLLTAAGLPPADKVAQASAIKAFETVIDEITARLAGKDEAVAMDSTLAKVRMFH